MQTQKVHKVTVYHGALPPVGASVEKVACFSVRINEDRPSVADMWLKFQDMKRDGTLPEGVPLSGSMYAVTADRKLGPQLFEELDLLQKPLAVFGSCCALRYATAVVVVLRFSWLSLPVLFYV